MKAERFFPLTLILALVLAACTEQARNTTGPDVGLEPAGKGQNNGGGGSNTAVLFSLSGGYDTDPAFQSAVIVSDNRNRMQIEGGGGCEPLFGCKDIAMTFAGKVGACSRDPADLDDVTYDELVAQLSDPLQNRTFYADIEKRGNPVSEVRSIYHESGSVGSQKYRTQLGGASAAEGPKDTFTLTGGSVWILKDGFGQSISCPFTGSGLVLTVNR